MHLVVWFGSLILKQIRLLKNGYLYIDFETFQESSISIITEFFEQRLRQKKDT
jgi:hypothetical protein